MANALSEPRLILVVDDDELISMSLADTLREAGYAVLTVNSGEEAVMLLDHAPELAGIVTDIRLEPGTDGWEVARRARKTHPGIPVVYITGHSAGREADSVPDSVMVHKPFVPRQILQAISGRMAASRATLH